MKPLFSIIFLFLVPANVATLHAAEEAPSKIEGDQSQIRGFIGVQFYLTNPLKLRDNISEIAAVVEGGPAEEAGIRPGDVILSIDGKKFPQVGEGKVNSLSAWMTEFEAGEEVKIKVQRGARELLFNVKLISADKMEKLADISEKDKLGEQAVPPKSDRAGG